jgi:hypothetical protein
MLVRRVKAADRRARALIWFEPHVVDLEGVEPSISPMPLKYFTIRAMAPDVNNLARWGVEVLFLATSPPYIKCKRVCLGTAPIKGGGNIYKRAHNKVKIPHKGVIKATSFGGGFFTPIPRPPTTGVLGRSMLACARPCPWALMSIMGLSTRGSRARCVGRAPGDRGACSTRGGMPTWLRPPSTRSMRSRSMVRRRGSMSMLR